MPAKKTNFFSEDIQYVLPKKRAVRAWLIQTIESEGCTLDELNFIFCSDAYLLALNQQFLSHDTYTDVITFDTSERPDLIAGDIFISVDRVKENAMSVGVSVFEELSRVMIHGTLHLLGYEDKSAKAKKQMTAKEDLYLSMLAAATLD